MADLETLFRPSSVAIIGASDRNPWAAIAARTLRDIGFRNTPHLVNPRGTPALGRDTIRSCRDADRIDAAFVAVPASALLDAIEDMAAAGVRSGAVVTSGFAEVGGEGVAAQARIFDRARDLGMTLLGPNSLGFSNFVDRVSLGAMPLRTPILTAPRVGLVSQSGATLALLAQMAHQQNVSLSYMVALGNEAMVDLTDVLRFLIADPTTKSIAVFAESIRNPEGFIAAAHAAAAARKPIVILKVGVGELTAAVAQAHTGALVGDDRVFQSICDAYNIVRVSSLEDLVLTADLLAALGPIDASKGFGLISPSGGACEIVADRGEELGIRFPHLAPATVDRLSSIISGYGAVHNPFDTTGAVLARPSLYSDSIEAIGGDPAIGLVAAVLEIPNSEEAASPMTRQYMQAVAAGFARTDTPGFVMQQTIKPFTSHSRAMLKEYGLPVVSGGLDHGMRAVEKLFDWSRRIGRPLPQRPSSVASATRPGDERETLAYLASRGVPTIPQHLAATRDEAVAAAAAIGGAVVLKILSPDIPHKTDVGGVALGLNDGEAVGEAFDRIIARSREARPDARIAGVIVAPMRTDGVELLVGVARDPVWGPVLAVGLGGLWVEIMQDTRLRVLPVTPADVRSMLADLKAVRLLQGYRRSRPADLDRLAAVIAAVGDAALALGDDLEALEINPLRVHGSDIEALDALAVWRQA